MDQIKEIGGYFPLEINYNAEYYKNEKTIRLNSGRAGIYFAVKALGCHKALIPYYLCESVGVFLLRHNIGIEYYHIDEGLVPTIKNSDTDCAILIVNYFGLITNDLKRIIPNNKNVIIDNTQAFFAEPINEVISIYSPRKFFGVPDGSYVIGVDENSAIDFPIDESNTTALYLLKQIECGTNASYNYYLENENRIAKSDVLRMSKLTNKLLCGIDYETHKEKRIENFGFVSAKLNSMNELKLEYNIEKSGCIPMVYPFLLKSELLRKELINKKIYVSQWWKYLIDNEAASEYERYLSKYLIPIPIDQRYSFSDLQYIINVCDSIL